MATDRGSSLLPTRSSSASSEKSELKAALFACRGAFAGIGLLTVFINILVLTGSIFMLEVYDRVLPSRSVPTLVGLAILTGALLSIQGILDLIRSRILVRIGASLDASLGRRVYTSLVRLPLRIANRGDGLQPLRDLDNVRSFLSGLGPTALFDLPWIPVYLGIIFAFHPRLGMVALCGALFLIVITFLTETLTRGPTRAASMSTVERNALAEFGSAQCGGARCHGHDRADGRPLGYSERSLPQEPECRRRCDGRIWGDLKSAGSRLECRDYAP